MIMRNYRVAGVWLFAASYVQAAEVGTAFTYQGHLENASGPVTDTCDFRFGLWDAAAGGNQVGGSPHTVNLVDVENGVFTAPIDFGPGAIDGIARWLEIEVLCPSDGGFTMLTPRVELTPAPYSIRAGEGVGGPNALNVTPSGDVGIGTTTPSALLDVNGAARAATVEITGGSPPQSMLAAWGRNDVGQTTVPFFETYVGIGAGSTDGVAIRTDGSLVGWGNNYGNGNWAVPTGTFLAVSLRDYINLAIRSDGTLVGWGSDNSGVLDVPAGTFTAVTAGSAHALAIRTDGTLTGWGQNQTGAATVPTGTFLAIAAGYQFSLAIRTDGTLVGWGCMPYFDYGQCSVPSGTFTAVAAGQEFGLAIRSDGTLINWGWNDGHTMDAPSGTFTAIAAGPDLALAIRSDGTLEAWGNSAYGLRPVPSGTFAAIATGVGFGLAIRSDPPTPDRPGLYLHTNTAVKPGTNTWTIFSDRRLKKNITPLSGALDRLLQLRGVTFQWLDPALQGGITGTQMGLIADEVQRAFPQWVGRDPRGYQTLTVGGFEALTAEALRELRAEKNRELDQMRAEKDCQLAELEERNADLETRLRHLEELLAPSSKQEGERP